MTPEQEQEIRDLAAKLYAAVTRFEGFSLMNVSNLSYEDRVRLTQDSAVAFTTLMECEATLRAAQKRIADVTMKEDG